MMANSVELMPQDDPEHNLDSPTASRHNITILYNYDAPSEWSRQDSDFGTRTIYSSTTTLAEAHKSLLEEEVQPKASSHPDGGLQAWLVVIGGFFLIFSGMGMIVSYGAFNTYYHNNTFSHYSIATTAWIGSLQSGLVFLLAIPGGAIYDRYGPRWIMAFGTTVCVSGYIGLSWCTSLWQYFVVQSVLIGVGIGAMFVCSLGGINEWFNKKKGLATGIVVAGSSMGSIVRPVLIANLPQKVGLAWTFRLVALMQLIFLTIATLLIRPRLPRQGNKPLFLPTVFFSHPAYTSLIISSVLFSLAYPVFLILCGQYALDIGAGKAAPYVLIACNAASGVGRVTSGVIADKWGYHNVMITGLIGSTVVMFSWMAIRDCNGLIGAAVAYGLLTGGNIALQGPCVVTVTKDVGSPGTLIGQMFGMQSIAMLLGPPVAGYIVGNNPVTQLKNYKHAIILNGSLLVLATGFAIAAKLLQNKDWRAKI